MFKGRKLVTMLVSLLAAVLLWLYVVTTVAPEATTRVSSIPISIDGSIVLEERGLIITGQDLTALSLELSSSRSNLSKLNAETIRVTADASKIREPGEYDLSCTVNLPQTVRSSDVDILRKSVDTVHITVSRLDTRTMEIQLNWTGTVKEGYRFEAESKVLDPASVVVSGPADELDRIDHAEVSFDISELEQTEIHSLELYFVDAEGEVLELSEYVTADVSIVKATLPVLRTKQITLSLQLLEGGGVKAENANITLEPETIWVKGAAEVIEPLPDDFTLGVVDLSAISDHEELQYTLTLPVGVTNVSGETEIAATVDLVGVTTDTIPISDIRIINGPEGYLTEAATRTAQVRVRGSTDEIRELQQNKDNGIYILVDLSDSTQTGAFTVAGRVVNTTHPAVSVMENVEIDVVISALEGSGSNEED